MPVCLILATMVEAVWKPREALNAVALQAGQDQPATSVCAHFMEQNC